MQLQFVWLRALSAYIVLMFPVAALATVINAGQIDADQIWSPDGNPYVIQGDVTVNAMLTIRSGVRVEFAGPFTLNIVGTLIAIGGTQELDKIVFTVSSNTIIPAALVFTSGSAVFDGVGYKSGSILENVIVEKIGGVNTLGAVVLFGARPYIHNSTFRNNGASGIYAYNIDGDLRIENNVIDNNSAILGGGLFVATMQGGSLLLQGNTVSNNTVTDSGGGLYLTVDGPGANITSNTFNNNQAAITAGGLFLTGNAGNVDASANTNTNAITLSGNIIQANNAALTGGGVFANKVKLAINAETVRGNSSGYNNGGGMFFQQSQVTMTKSLVLRNRSRTMGGGIFLLGGTYTISDSVLAMNESELTHGGGIDMHGFPTVTIDHSVVAGNKAPDYGAGVSITEGICTVQNSAIVLNELGNAIGVKVSANLQGNTIAYNSARPDSVFKGATIGIDTNAKLAMADNNIIGNATSFDVVTFYNGPIQAASNWWGTTDSASILGRINLGDAAPLASVDPRSPLFSPNTNAPISPPSGVTALPTASTLKLTWNANPESDTQGYRIYWGTKPFPEYEHVADVTKDSTSYEIPLAEASGFVAVTAYDADYLSMNDDPATPVNEYQTRGHESWYAQPSSTIAMSVTPTKNQKKDGVVLSFKITVTNNGPSVGFGDFIVTHTLSSGLSYYYATDNNGIPSADPILPQGCSLSAGEVTCIHAPIDPSKSVEIFIPARVTTSMTTDEVSIVTVHPAGVDTAAAINQAQVILHVNSPDLAVSWSSMRSVNIGVNADYTVTVKNMRAFTADNTELDVVIPAGITISSLLDSRCVAMPEIGHTRVSCALGDVAGGGGAPLTSVTFGLTGDTPGDVVLVAEAFTRVDGDATNNQARASVTITDPTQITDNSGQDVTSSSTGSNKGGGGLLGLEWLLMYVPLIFMRRRFRDFSAVS